MQVFMNEAASLFKIDSSVIRAPYSPRVCRTAPNLLALSWTFPMDKETSLSGCALIFVVLNSI